MTVYICHKEKYEAQVDLSLVFYHIFAKFYEYIFDNTTSQVKIIVSFDTKYFLEFGKR